jgi:hypothetical protein
MLNALATRAAESCTEFPNPSIPTTGKWPARQEFPQVRGTLGNNASWNSQGAVCTGMQ